MCTPQRSPRPRCRSLRLLQMVLMLMVSAAAPRPSASTHKDKHVAAETCDGPGAEAATLLISEKREKVMFVGNNYVANARARALSLSNEVLVRLACVCFKWEVVEGSKWGREKEGFVA